MELIEAVVRGMEVRNADPDDEQYVRWRMPLLLEAMTATRFRNRAKRIRPKRRWK